MNIIKEERLKKGYTQEQIARLLNITTQTYINIEKGRHTPNVKTGLLLCKLLDLNPYKTFMQ